MKLELFGGLGWPDSTFGQGRPSLTFGLSHPSLTFGSALPVSILCPTQPDFLARSGLPISSI